MPKVTARNGKPALVFQALPPKAYPRQVPLHTASSATSCPISLACEEVQDAQNRRICVQRHDATEPLLAAPDSAIGAFCKHITG